MQVFNAFSSLRRMNGWLLGMELGQNADYGSSCCGSALSVGEVVVRRCALSVLKFA